MRHLKIFKKLSDFNMYYPDGNVFSTDLAFVEENEMIAFSTTNLDGTYVVKTSIASGEVEALKARIIELENLLALSEADRAEKAAEIERLERELEAALIELALKDEAIERLTEKVDVISGKVDTIIEEIQPAKINDAKQLSSQTYYAFVNKAAQSGMSVSSDENGLPTWVDAPAVVETSKINDNYQSTATTYYAFNAKAAESGLTVISDENGLPIFVEKDEPVQTAKINDLKQESAHTYYAFTEKGAEGKVVSANTEGLPIWVDAPKEIETALINDAKQTSAQSYYAFVAKADASGKTVISDENGLPKWCEKDPEVQTAKLNDLKQESGQSYYVFTEKGAEGKVVSANSEGYPTWVDAPKEIETAKINDLKQESAHTYYAFVEKGSEGKVVSASTEGLPIWVDAPKEVETAKLNDKVQESGDTYYVFNAKAEKSGMTVVSNENGLPIFVEKDKEVETAVINGLKQTSAQTYFAPTTMGADNTVLMASGDNFVWNELETKEFSGVSGITIKEEGNKVIIGVELPDEIEVAKINDQKQTSAQTYYAFTAKGAEGKVVSADTNGLPIWVDAPEEVQTAKINDLKQESAQTYYAVSEKAVTSGKTIISNEEGLPVWGELPKETETAVINGLKQTSAQTYFAPTTMGADNEVLIASGGNLVYTELETKEFSGVSGIVITEVDNKVVIGAEFKETETAKINDAKQTSAQTYYALSEKAVESGKTVISDENGLPIWTDSVKSKVTLNGVETEDAKFYAPLSGGTDGQLLVSKGEGNAPEFENIDIKQLSAGTDINIEEKDDKILISANIKSVKLSAGTNIEFVTDADDNLVISSTASGSSETAKINDLAQLSSQTYYAVTSKASASGKSIVSDENGLPVWGDAQVEVETAKINDAKQLSSQTYYALSEKTTESGKTVVSDENGLPVWGEVVKAKKLSAGTNVELDLSGDTITISSKGGDESARINDLVQTSAQTYYAPTEWGTSGQVLTSKGEDNAPEWQDHIMIVPITNADYSALTEDEKNDEFKVYALTDSDGTGVGDDGLIMLNDTPLANHAEDSFYAPTTKPTLDGQVAVSSSSSSVPVWSTLLDMIYPVGSIYITVSNSLPSFFTANGEEWEKVAEGNSLWTVSDAELGTSLSGSLPSITGSISTMFAKGDEPVVSQGALSGENNVKSWKSGTNNELWRTTLTLNAAKSSAVYSGTDDTVRPTSLGVSMWIRKS